MNPINRKPAEKTENIFYGIDVNDKQAVQKEYKRLKQRHRLITLFVIAVLIGLGFIIFDFVRVNSLGGKPLFAKSEKVENGTLFSGIGYKVLYCDDGNRYIGSVLYKSCSEPDMVTFSHVVYEELIKYGEKENIIDSKQMEKLVINSVEHDEENDQGGSDYLLDITFSCKDGKNRCFRTDKEFNDPNNIKIYARINKFNEVYEIKCFKKSGKYYDTLKETYTEKVKAYLIEKSMFDEENVNYYRLTIEDNNGKYKFRGTTYADTYLIKIDYTCKDNGDTCIDAFDKKDYEGDYANLSFYASMFLDEEGNVLLVGPREYLDME